MGFRPEKESFMYNVNAIGFIATDVKSFANKNGGTDATFRMGFSRRSRNGEESTTFRTVWLRNVGNALSYLVKGKRLQIVGEEHDVASEYNGQQRIQVTIEVFRFEFISSGNSQNQQNGAAPAAAKPQQKKAAAPAPALEDYSIGGPENYGDDDVPF